MGRVERLAGIAQVRRQDRGIMALQQQIDDHRGIDDDHDWIFFAMRSVHLTC